MISTNSEFYSLKTISSKSRVNMKKIQLPRFKDHIGLGEKPKYKSYLLRLHEEDANNDEDEDFESKQNELCLKRRVLSHPKKRMQLFLENDEKSNHDLSESTNLAPNNNVCSQTQCPPDAATENVGFPTNRLDDMLEITRLPYPQSLSQIPVNQANLTTSNSDLDSLKQRKLPKEFKSRNGFGAGYNGSPFSSHLMCSPKHTNSVVSRPRPGHQYSRGKYIGKHLVDDRSTLQNTSCSNPTTIDDTFDHSMDIPFANSWMCSDHDGYQQNTEQEGKLFAGIQIFDDFLLDKKEHHSYANPNASRSPHSEYILPQSQRHDEGLSVRSSTSSPYARGMNSAQDLRLPNSSRKLAQIINEVSCGKQSVLRQLVPLKSAHTRQLVGDPALRRRSGFHEQELWQNDNRKDPTHPPCDAELGVDGMHHHGGAFQHYPNLSAPRHEEDVTLYPSNPPQHYGYGPPLQYMPYERENIQAEHGATGTTAPSLSARDKTISWLSSGDSSNFTPYKPADPTSSTSHNPSSANKSDDYHGRPMAEWEFRHIAHFLIEATHDLGIQYEYTDFSQLSKVNGQKLIAMRPEHFEKFAPSQGQRIYDYVRRHKNHELLTNGTVDSFVDSSPDAPSMCSLETPPVSYSAPTWTSVSDDTYSYYPPVNTLPAEKNFSDTKNQSPDSSDKVPSPYSSMSMDTLPTTSTFSGQAPFQFQVDACSSELPGEHQTQLNSTPQPMQYLAQPLMNSGSLPPPTSVENRTSYHSQAQRSPNSSGSQREKPGLLDVNRPSSSMSATISEIEESSDDDEEDEGEGDDEEDEEEEIKEKVIEVIEEKPPEPPKKRGPGRPPKPESERKKKKKTGRLWEFIRNLLLSPETCPSIVRWEDSETGVFRFVQSEKVAEKWGMRKNNKKMNYEKLSRAMRYYYKGKVFEPVLGRRLVYKFGVNAKGWNPNKGNFGE